MAVSARTKEILEILDRNYGTEYKCYLNHMNAYELLVATILSAQCTDARVNMVTGDLFREYPDPAAMAAADIKRVEELIHSVGFYCFC